MSHKMLFNSHSQVSHFTRATCGGKIFIRTYFGRDMKIFLTIWRYRWCSVACEPLDVSRYRVTIVTLWATSQPPHWSVPWILASDWLRGQETRWHERQTSSISRHWCHHLNTVTLPLPSIVFKRNYWLACFFLLCMNELNCSSIK